MSEKKTPDKKTADKKSKAKKAKARKKASTPKKASTRKPAEKKAAAKKAAEKKGTGKKATGELKLPDAGLAEEILASLEGDDGEGAETPEGPDRVLRFADQVARRREETGETKEPTETWVSFRIEPEIFALPVAHVREVIRVDNLTRVPHAPFPVRGITTLRGQILTVVDLRRRLGLGATELRAESRILVVSVGRRTLGLLVEGVDQVSRILPSRIESPPEDVLTDQSDYILGVYPLDDELLILLDLDTVMVVRDPERIEAGAEPEGGTKS